MELDAFKDLKDLHDETDVTIIFSGTPEMYTLLEMADLAGSFPYHCPMDALSEDDFIKVLNTIEEKALNLPFKSNLGEGEKLELLTKSTGSLIGRLMKFLPTAILYSVQKASGQEENNPESKSMYKLDSISLEAIQKVGGGFGIKALPKKVESK
jgi:hypothetical protein